ncbi:MAG: type II secretion system minor pseudopilin GspI [Sterolibacterium sp.]|nr:type II secretion system minor pseudopilin GspI [Sterolibacterium sp.]
MTHRLAIRQGSARGFTLLEVLVALTLLAIALMAALRASALVADQASALQQRQLADWVAENRFEEHRAHRDWPAPGRYSAEVEQGGQRFVWQENISTTPNSQFRRIDIEVRVAPATSDSHHGSLPPTPALARLSGFLVHPRN